MHEKGSWLASHAGKPIHELLETLLLWPDPVGKIGWVIPEKMWHMCGGDGVGMSLPGKHML
jgi:hypothetical protein